MRILLQAKKGGLRRLGTPVIMALGFLVIIAVGTLLLMLPLSSAEGVFTGPLTAAFTAVSATCVTGLSVVNTGVHWSVFGQAVILLMIQIGGLGFMTLTVLLLLLIRHAVSPKERMMVAMSYNLPTYENTTSLVRRIVTGTVCLELAGTLLLFTQFIRYPGLSAGEALWRSFFTAVSAFCNAGFDLMGEDGMAVFSGNWVVNLTLIALIMLGGLGFVVWSDLESWLIHRRRLSVYTRLVLGMTAALFLAGAFLFAVLEWNNPDTIGSFPSGQKILMSLFQSATLRTAGFSMFDNGGMRNGTLVLSMVLMFIGGASGSTAGGVKVVTVAVLFWTVFSVAFGRPNPVICKRQVSKDSFIRAVSVVVMQLLLVLLGAAVVSAVTPFSLTQVMFEVISAVSTVGLTLGVTPALPALAKLMIMLLMYLGRVGILTVTYAAMMNLRRDQNADITYPEANLLIG
jgi:trk system potassium uptake protein TrkH